ncbi:MAG TPA: hypothetical protein OIM60_02255 [Clostridiaceae bacterium]|nr:hypothetical protein [Clostridiaceae bacterium]
MELKTNYQYTYFIHPFIVKENRYQKYLLKLLKDKKCNIKIFKKEKDLKLYKYFLPEIRKFLFSSFDFTPNKLKELEKLPIETQSALLSRYPCTMFEYVLEKDIQGKTGEEKGIFFGIRKLEIICFNTGICFLCIKTNIENTNRFDDLLNFNYKFRDIKQQFQLSSFDKIRIQTDAFEDVKSFTDFIGQITGANLEAAKYDIDTERFLSYSYACIEQDYWNEYRKFENIEHNFIKFTNIMPASNIASFIKDESVTISEWKYAKLGLTKQGITLFSSATEMNNYTILPEEFETQYFYTYILNLYKKIYLKKLGFEFSNSKNVKKARKKFIEFTKKIWIQEITEDEAGTIINHRLNEVLELDSLYLSTKNKYDVLYKDLNIEKNSKSTIIIAIILLASLIFNIMNFIQILNK